MKAFIHLLSSPACIISFDGAFIDVNQWFVRSFKADSKEQFLNSRLPDLVLDKVKYKIFLDYLLSGETIHNEKLIMKNMNGNNDLKIINASLLSQEKQLIFIQIFELFLYTQPEINHSQLILNEISRLSSQLSQSCKEFLNEIITNQKNALIDNQLDNRIAHLTQRLAFEYPILSKNETIVGSLYILGFSSMEIGLWVGFPIGTVKDIIFSICQKLNMQSRDEMVEAFLAIDYPGQWQNNLKIENEITKDINKKSE